MSSFQFFCLILILLPQPARAISLSAGEVIIASASAGLLLVDPVTGDLEPIYQGPETVGAISSAIRAPGGILHVSRIVAFDQGTPGLVSVDPSSGSIVGVLEDAELLAAPLDLAFDHGGNLYIANHQGSILSRETDGTLSVVSSGGLLANPIGLAIDLDGSLLVSDNGTRAIVRVNPLTGEQELVWESSSIAFHGLAIDRNGFIVLATDNAVVRIDSGAGSSEVLVGLGTSTPFDVAIEPTGSVLIALPNAGQLLRFDPVSGHTITLATDAALKTLFGITVVPVPSPTTLSLLAFGLVILANRRNEATRR